MDDESVFKSGAVHNKMYFSNSRFLCILLHEWFSSIGRTKFATKNMHSLQWHYMSVVTSQITFNSVVCSRACLGYQRKCQKPAPLLLVESSRASGKRSRVVTSSGIVILPNKYRNLKMTAPGLRNIHTSYVNITQSFIFITVIIHLLW